MGSNDSAAITAGAATSGAVIVAAAFGVDCLVRFSRAPSELALAASCEDNLIITQIFNMKIERQLNLKSVNGSFNLNRGKC